MCDETLSHGATGNSGLGLSRLRKNFAATARYQDHAPVNRPGGTFPGARVNRVGCISLSKWDGETMRAHAHEEANYQCVCLDDDKAKTKRIR